MPQNSKWRRNTRTVPQNGNAKWYIQETRKEVQYMEMKNWTSGVMECFYKIKPFDEEEEHIGDTERECLENRDKGEWLWELQLEATKRQVESESQDELCREQVVTVEAETIQTNFGTVEEEMNDVEDSVGEIKGHLSKESQANVE